MLWGCIHTQMRSESYAELEYGNSIWEDGPCEVTRRLEGWLALGWVTLVLFIAYPLLESVLTRQYYPVFLPGFTGKSRISIGRPACHRIVVLLVGRLIPRGWVKNE
jgi:hypothetical protein